MKHYLALARKELHVKKITSLLILIAIIMSSMLTTVIGQSAGVLSAMRQQQAIALGGNRHATFVQRSSAEVEQMRQDPRLAFVGTYIQLGSAKLNRALTLSLLEYQENVEEIYPNRARLKAGRLPQTPQEIALPEDVVQYMGLSGNLGETVSLQLNKALRHGVEIESYDFSADFKLVGITESNYLKYTSGLVDGLVGSGTAESLLPARYIYYIVDFRVADVGNFQNTVQSLIEQLHIHELDTIYNIPYLDALGIAYNLSDSYENLSGISDSGFSFMLAAGIMIGLLLILAAGLVIYNILKISITQRIREYGVLRAIGGDKRQLYLLVCTQVLLLCAVGLPLGLLLGLLCAQGILTTATSLLSPDIFLVQNAAELNALIAQNSSGKISFLAASAAITLFFALLAALPAASYAAHVSPTVAMAGQIGKHRRRRPNKRTSKKIRSFERYYAWLNLSRSPGRTTLTILSLVMSISVFIVLQNSLDLLDTARRVNDHLGDYSLINETIGFSPDDLAELENMEEVTSVAALQLKLYNTDSNAAPIGIAVDLTLHPGETFQIAGLNKVFVQAIFDERLSPQELAQLNSGEGCVVRNPLPLVFDGEEIPRTEIKAGDILNIAGRNVPVLATLDGYDTYISVGNSGFTNGVQAIVSSELYAQLTGESVYHELKPSLQSGADRSRFDSLLDELTQRLPGTTWLSYAESDRQSAESFAQIKLLGWGLIIFIGLIGILNIINTVYTNIHTRIKEIGIQRAIGQSAGGLYAVFLWESIYLGLIASVIGAVCGWLGTILINAAENDSLTLSAPPLLSMAEATLMAVAACLLATLPPLRSASQISIVDALENNENI